MMDRKIDQSKKNQLFHACQQYEQIFEICSYWRLIFEPFSQNFEQFFPNFAKCFQKMFWIKSLQI